MVWSTTQSTLNKAVNDYNKTIDEVCEYPETNTERLSSQMLHNCDNKAENPSNNYSGREKIQQSKPKNCRATCRVTNNSNPTPFFDRDFLLLAGLIYILSKEGADQKLILALIIVLLG